MNQNGEPEMTEERRGTTANPVFPKQILSVVGDPIYEDESDNSGSRWPVLGVAFLVAVFFIWDLGRMMDHYQETQSFWGSIDYASIVFVLFAIYYLLGQALTSYHLRLTDTALICEYRTWFRTHRTEIPYDCLYGVHTHKARVANNVKFRYKWRWYSLLDSRPLYALFCKIPRPGKKPQFGRALFKAEPQFLLGLNEYLPGRVGITEEETTYHVLLDESKRMDEVERLKAARKQAK